MANTEATEIKINALRDGLDEVRKAVRELRGEMHSGFAALRERLLARK